MVARIIGEAGAPGRRPRNALGLLDRLRCDAVIDIVDLAARDRVAVGQPQVLRQRERQAQRPTRGHAAEGGHLRHVHVLVEQVEAGRHVAIQEARLGEAQIHLQALGRASQPQAQELPLAQQVALGDADVADHAFARRIASAEGQLAGRLLHQLHVEHDAILRRAGPPLDLHGLEEAERSAAASWPCRPSADCRRHLRPAGTRGGPHSRACAGCR